LITAYCKKGWCSRNTWIQPSIIIMPSINKTRKRVILQMTPIGVRGKFNELLSPIKNYCATQKNTGCQDTYMSCKKNTHNKAEDVYRKAMPPDKLENFLCKFKGFFKGFCGNKHFLLSGVLFLCPYRTTKIIKKIIVKIAHFSRFIWWQKRRMFWG